MSMDFFQDFGWYIVGTAFLLFITSIFHYKASFENKGKKFLLIPFFTILGLYTLFFVFALIQGCHGEGCMGIAYGIFGFPFVILVPVGAYLIVKFLFRIFQINSLKRFKTFLVGLFIVTLLPLVLFGFAPGDEHSIEQRAVMSGNVKICDRIFIQASGDRNTLARESCKFAVARKIKNFEVCKTFKNLQMRQECASWAAAQTGKDAWCTLLEEPQKSDCEQVVQTTNWMRQNFCTYGSYTSCLGSLCPQLFTYDKFASVSEWEVNSCLTRLAIQKNNETACQHMLPIPGWSGRDDAVMCTEFFAQVRNISDLCAPGQSQLDCLNSYCPEHNYSLQKLQGCIRAKAIDTLDVSLCKRIIHPDEGWCESQIYAQQRKLR